MSESAIVDPKLWIDLCIRQRIDMHKNLSNKSDDIEDNLKELSESDLISGFNVVKVPSSVRIQKNKKLTSTDHEKGRENEFKTYQRWAQRNGLSLEPFFGKDGQLKHEVIEFPEIYLIVKDGSDRFFAAPAAPYPDRDDLATVRGVFPCSDSKRKYEIEDYLSAVKNGKHWRHSISQESLSTPDHGRHGGIKSHLYQNPNKTVGSQWVKPQDEYRVGDIFSDDKGQIDLLFEHESESKFLIVEVKPEKSLLDKAIGQIYRYKYKFLQEANLPHITPDDIKLAIAAPEFHDTHVQAATELDIDLIQAP